MTEAADLLQTADQFAQDLIANNIAALMPVFTPVGIGQAMALQAQPGSAEGSESFEIEDQGDNLLHITFRGPESAGGRNDLHAVGRGRGPLEGRRDRAGRVVAE